MSTIGPYQLLNELGSGGFGRVYRAEHAELGLVRAVKVATDPEFIRQRRTEGQVLVRLARSHSGAGAARPYPFGAGSGEAACIA